MVFSLKSKGVDRYVKIINALSTLVEEGVGFYNYSPLSDSTSVELKAETFNAIFDRWDEEEIEHCGRSYKKSAKVGKIEFWAMCRK